ncbi:hypothetical protein DFH06DRAFT_1310035 [Mycena polygramma]|nr:hypothetical protein DFH06DRAFT_1310035 [Mycena polygramma]
MSREGPQTPSAPSAAVLSDLVQPMPLQRSNATSTNIDAALSCISRYSIPRQHFLRTTQEPTISLSSRTPRLSPLHLLFHVSHFDLASLHPTIPDSSCSINTPSQTRAAGARHEGQNQIEGGVHRCVQSTLCTSSAPSFPSARHSPRYSILPLSSANSSFLSPLALPQPPPRICTRVESQAPPFPVDLVLKPRTNYIRSLLVLVDLNTPYLEPRL